MVLCTVYYNRKQNKMSETKETLNKDIPMHCYGYIFKGLTFQNKLDNVQYIIVCCPQKEASVTFCHTKMQQTLEYVRQQVILMCSVTLWYVKFQAKHAQSNNQTLLQRIETFLTHLNSPLCVIPNKRYYQHMYLQVHDCVCVSTNTDLFSHGN
jgi:hypothetical protein